MNTNDLVLIGSISLLLLALALLLHRRGVAARTRLEEAQRAALNEDLGGNSYFMPLPKMEQAVELDNPVEIESLLDGAPAAIADHARDALERTTDADFTGGLRGLPLEIGGSPVPMAPPAPAPVAAPVVPLAVVAKPEAPGDDDGGITVPVRELVLAWFEARGYRAAALGSDSLPIELLLRHRTDQSRAYAFCVESKLLTQQRATSLLALARASGHTRLLIAAEGDTEPGLAKAVHRQGIRVYNDEDIRAALRKIDISIAAKIIALARRRATTRASRPGDTAAALATPRAAAR